MNQKNQLSAVHFGLFILSGEMGLGIIAGPADLVRIVGHDGWITVLLTGALALGLTFITLLLLRHYQNLSIYEINRRLFGRRLGQVFNWLLLAYLVTVAGYFLRVFSEYIRLFNLVNIPPAVVSFLIITPTLFLTWQGYRAIGRFSYFLLVILGAIVVLVYQVSSDIRISFLQPPAAAGWPNLIRAIPTVALAFVGLEVGTFIYDEVKDRNRALFWGMGATAVNLIFVAMINLCSTGLFGEVMLKRLVAPLFSISQYARFPLLERMDLFFFILWFPLLETTFRVYFATSYTGIRKLLHWENKPLYLGLFTCLVFGMSLTPADLNQMVLIGKTVACVGMAVILYLTVCWGISLARRRESEG